MTDKYWVGMTASWDATAGTKWALTPGGVGGQAVPTNSDNVYFDALSGAVTVTVAASAACANLDFTGVAGLTAFTGTFAGSSALNIAGSLTLSASMTRTYTGAITFSSTATGKTITLNGKTTASAVTFNGAGGGWTLQDAWNNGSGAITLTNGSLNINGNTATWGVFSSDNSNTRTLTLGASTINCTGWDFTTTTGLTFTCGTSIINFTGTGNHHLGAQTYATVNFIATSASLFENNTFTNLSRTNTSGYGIFYITGNSQTVTGTFTVTGNNNSNNRILVSSGQATAGVSSTVTAATVSLANVDFQDVIGAGAATWSGTSIGNCGRNSGITFTTPVNRYWIHPVGATADIFNANWATSSGGAAGANFPLPQDTAIFDANSFGASGKTVQIVSETRMGNMNWAAATNSPTLNFGSTLNQYGSITLTAAMSLTGSSNILFPGDYSSMLISAGLTYPVSFNIFKVGGSLSLGDDLIITGSLNLNSGTLTGGTFNANNCNVTALSVANSGTNVRALSMGSGLWVLTGTAPWQQSDPTNLTFTKGTGTIKFTNSSASSKTFAGGGLTYSNFWNATGSTGVVIITGSNTFADIKIDPGRTQQFTTGTTTTFATLTINGTIGNVITIGSVTAANHNLVKTGGGYVSGDYLSISRSQASGASFYAGANSTDGGNNTGWIFTAPVIFAKTINGIPITNSKTINGIPKANIKTWNSL